MRREQKRRKKSAQPSPASPQEHAVEEDLLPIRQTKPVSQRGRDDPWDIWYFQRHPEDDAARAVPGQEFLRSCPSKVRADLVNILLAVAKSPPNRFAGGGMWKAMHDMRGMYEARTKGPRKQLYRLYCVLDYQAGVRSSLVVIDGRSKDEGTDLSKAEYARIRALGEEYLARLPRSVC